ncbi:DUF4347 domain-containing protein, partial [Microcoleus sp. Aus8_D3]
MKTLAQVNKKNPFVGFTSNQPREIVILDPTVPDSHHLVEGIEPDTETYILNSQPNAIEQITTLLAQHQDIAALHIISHGAPGHIQLGNTQLNSQTLPHYSQQIQQWRNSLTADAEIIIYGCNVAATTDDFTTDNQKPNHQPTTHPLQNPLQNPLPNFLHQLHQLTDAKIAANPHPTGNSKLGGNWNISQLIPPSPQRPKLAIVETTLKTYSGILGFATKVDFPTGSFPISVSIGDFNGDGKPDVATAHRFSYTTSILLNTTTTGATTPTFAPKVDFP